MKILWLLISASLLGCASAPPAKPQLPDTGYVQHVRNKITVSNCVSNGWMTPEVGAFADTYSDTELSRYSYDQQRMSAVWAEGTAKFNPAQSDCNILAMWVARTKNQIDEAKEREMEQQRNKPVTCYTNFGVTTCY